MLHSQPLKTCLLSFLNLFWQLKVVRNAKMFQECIFSFLNGSRIM